MRRSLVVIAATVLLTACAGASSPNDEAPVADAPLRIEAGDELLPTGRAALAAAHGTPHVLWFWGAH